MKMMQLGISFGFYYIYLVSKKKKRLKYNRNANLTFSVNNLNSIWLMYMQQTDNCSSSKKKY